MTTLPPLPEEVVEKLPKRLPRIEKLEDVPRYLESQGLLLDDLNVRLQHLIQLTQTMLEGMQKVPEGLIFPVEKTITGNAVTKFDIEEEPEAGYKPWYSCTIYNDGDSAVYVQAHTYYGRFQKVLEGESLELDFHAPKLKKLYFKCLSSGDSASLRIVGER